MVRGRSYDEKRWREYIFEIVWSGADEPSIRVKPTVNMDQTTKTQP